MTGIGHFTSAAARSRYFAAYDKAMADGPVPLDQLDVPTTFGTVRVHRHGGGTGTPVVLLHGRAATSAMWQPNLRALAAERPVYTLDSLGEPGRSVQALPITSGADQAGWLAEVLTELDVPAAHLVGASAGGWLAFNHAVHAPEQVASMTLLDPANVLARFSPGFLIGAFSTLPAAPRSLTDQFLAWTSGDPPMDSPVARLLLAGLREYRMHLPMPSYPGDDVLRSLRVPTLALIGGRSVVHDPEAAKARALRLIRGCEAEVWPDASHAISGEQADRVNNRINTFLSRRA
ncbi:alpha/beta fold hydrolase [Pseudonocardia sp. TRM90224]|uniref:alpha/beta fold hydrolase n=1 Tax=Pseudonocardia sp. TRM90224 TaxID=2812678 RepID=UPI001E2C96B7|nr:alpha/beta fold hydrolase [Pseudonocardia sp. TRM90224]